MILSEHLHNPQLSKDNPFLTEYPELFQTQFNKQKEQLLHLGFPKFRKISIDAYIEMLPDFIMPDYDMVETHPYLLLVDPFSPLLQIEHIYPVEDDMHFCKPNTLGNTPGIETPDIPYQVLLSDGKHLAGLSYEQAKQRLSPNERFATLQEGLVLRKEFPNVWYHTSTPYSLSFGGSTIQKARGLCIKNGTEILSPDHYPVTPALSHYYVNTGFELMPHMELDAYLEPTREGISNGWPTAIVLPIAK